MVRHLEAALRPALPGVPGGWVTVQDAARALEASPAERALLVVDDAHGLEGTAAEVALGRFVEYAPRWLAIVIGSRLAPSINLSRLRVAGDLVEIGPDDLRFRAWEVERLFRDHYGEPVPPDELAVLARRTEGWAAGLQLFHLATRGKSADERRRILAAVGAGSRLIREYLTWNVLADLPEELREFLVETCVLGRLTGPLCDKLLGPARQRGPPRRAVPAPDLHGRARRGRRVVPLPRGLPVAPRPDARRPGGGGGGPRPLRPGRGAARGGRGDRGGAGRVQPSGGLGRGSPVAGRAGRAAGRFRAGLAREPAAGDRPPRAVARAGVRPAGEGGGPLDRRARRVRPGRGRLRGVVDRARLPSRATGAPDMVRARDAGPDERLVADPPLRRRA